MIENWVASTESLRSTVLEGYTPYLEMKVRRESVIRVNLDQHAKLTFLCSSEGFFRLETRDGRIKQLYSGYLFSICQAELIFIEEVSNIDTTLRSVAVAAVAEWYRYRTVACLVTSSSPVPLKTRCVGQRCTLNLSRAETSSRWCGVVVRRGGASSGVVHVT
ncbi:uncharacterized protein TNCV_2691431 [Trichonephila clavipes]|uniref:Uncharacterized protein n=1 Tax=Trichonephila clavipes TaxID=2585209 RepID=A0A8X6VYL0_TRICX|nr:uncharacterized protein TNCV_2691431 [Trichonephila clavipes]